MILDKSLVFLLRCTYTLQNNLSVIPKTVHTKMYLDVQASVRRFASAELETCDYQFLILLNGLRFVS